MFDLFNLYQSMPEPKDAIMFMEQALRLARKGWGLTHPNPMVGAVIVEDGHVVAEGWHQFAGSAHAEVDAFQNLKRHPADNATLYVTLEPCSTHGRTGACTLAIINSGIRRVVVGARDPNPAHAGRGLTLLRDAGIEVHEAVLEKKCSDLNLIFNHSIRANSPLLAAKIATTFEGAFSPSDGVSRWVTGPVARADVMHWRRYFPAIAVSANTALTDNPSLTCRITGTETWCPVRFVFDRTLKLRHELKNLKLFNDRYADRTIVVCADGLEAHVEFLEAGIEIWQLPDSRNVLNWEAFRKRCHMAGLNGVYIESGPRLTEALISNKIIDYLFHYRAPKNAHDSMNANLVVTAEEDEDTSYDLNHSVQEIHEPDRLTRGWLS